MASSTVTQIPAAAPEAARAHFANRLSLETDCADVHEAMCQAGRGAADFVLLDVRGPQSYARAHVPGAINLPHRQITAERMALGRPARCSWSIAPGRTATAPTEARYDWPSSSGG